MFKKILGVGLVNVMCFGFVTGVLAAEEDITKSEDVKVNITGGGMSLEAPKATDFGDVIIKKEPKVYHTGFGADKLVVKDFTGKHEGWNVQLQATQFQNTEGYKLPKGTLTIGNVSTIKRVEGPYEGSGGNLPTQTLGDTPKMIDEGEAVTVLNAETGKGAGEIEVGFGENALGLTIDATTAKVGTYTSTLMWTLEAGPMTQ